MSTHEYIEDVRNKNILIYINGDLVPRNDAKISVFDSGFLLGDGVWEGIRLHNGKLAFGQAHFDRLYGGAKALDINIGMPTEELKAAVMSTVEANSMDSGVHIRLIVSRGLKRTPYQHPDIQDTKLNTLSKHNCIAACIEADKAGYDEALMLDLDGNVSTCNSTNFFIVRDGEVWTSTGEYCLNGITRGNIVSLCRENDLPVYEKDFSLTDVYSSNEVFVTGTFGGVIPVSEVDGNIFSDGKRGTITERLQGLYAELIKKECPE